MSQKSQSKSRVKKIFNIDKEARKYYSTPKMSGDVMPMPIYVPQRITRFQIAYRQMAA
jgi:hypothetical protein